MSDVRVLLVEDHELLAQSLCVALTARGVPAEVAPLSNASQLVALVEALRPRVVLLDLDLGPDFGDGAGLIARFSNLRSSVLIVSGTPDPLRIAAAIELGAAGYVHKSQPLDQLLATVLALLAGDSVLPPAERDEMLARLRRHRTGQAAVRARFERLTKREQQVLRQLGDGHSVDEIATAWVVAPATVRSQVRGILTKLGVGSQLAAVAQARVSGWLAEESRS